jgi:hypothetical protein
MATDLNAVLMTGTSDPTPAPEPSPADHERPVHVDEDDGDRWDGGEGPGDDAGDKRPEPGPEVPPASDDDEDSDRPVPVKALREERKKRQELERRLAALTTPQDPREDPTRARLDLSVEYAKEQFKDYEEAETAFVETVKAHPRGREIYEAMLKDKHPAKFAYTVGKQLLALDEIGDPTTYRQRVLAERETRTPKSSPSLPPTLAGSRDSGGRFSPRDGKTATPLSEILAR